jgi:ribosomal protein S18 acetylase RimI-like enzyme
MTAITIRPYQHIDRQAVRDICYRTGYMGDPIKSQWADEASFANLFTSYYTDREPESALVAERNDVVIGYLLGCRDTGRSTSPARTFLAQFLTRFLALRPGTAQFIRRSIADTATDVVHHEKPPVRLIDPRWPAHLHINLLPDARRHGAGRNLVQEWLQTLERDGAPGCHLETLAENTSAIAFFKSCGFAPIGTPKPVPGLRAPDGSRHHLQVMVHTVQPIRPLGRNT